MAVTSKKVDGVFGLVNCLKIISDIANFKNWLRDTHGMNAFEDVTEGYKFSAFQIAWLIFSWINTIFSVGIIISTILYSVLVYFGLA